MTRLCRVLGIVAAVALAGFLIQWTLASYPLRAITGSWFAYSPQGPGSSFYTYLFFSLLSSALGVSYAPVVSTLGIVASAQGRNWVWLGVFTLLGMLALLATAMFISVIEDPFIASMVNLNPLPSNVFFLIQAPPSIAGLAYFIKAWHAEPQNAQESVSHAQS